ncbi:hypothetical protein Bca52824_035252 [Brassica carinata]|uniref:WRKY domain-containing protein n=1 Tax=Brassica carinata TaxID=52824 RepID=A0A8X7S4Y0_BRACI|nr:hypothetical protein Bca52824_035252 [Brassica carinata]
MDEDALFLEVNFEAGKAANHAPNASARPTPTSVVPTPAVPAEGVVIVDTLTPETEVHPSGYSSIPVHIADVEPVLESMPPPLPAKRETVLGLPAPSAIPAVAPKSRKRPAANPDAINPPGPIPNDGPLETREISGGTHATMIISNNNLPQQLKDLDLHPQGASVYIRTEESVDITSHEDNNDPVGAPVVPSLDSEIVAETDVMNLFSLESGSEDDDKDREYNQEKENIEDRNIVIEPSPQKRRKNVVTNMIRVTRQNKTQRVLIQVEGEEDHPDDGFRWRKYSQKVATWNENPSLYISFTSKLVRKYLEISTDNVKLVVATYYGIYEHVPPSQRISKSSTKNQSGLSMSQVRNYARWYAMLPSSVSASQLFPSPLAPQLDMMQYYMDGLSKQPSLPFNQNHGLLNWDDEMKIDHVISMIESYTRR